MDIRGIKINSALTGFFVLLGTLYLTAQDIVWLETENFDDLGGWTKDWQFMDQMGSPYIMSIGYGIPVKDAITRFSADKNGYYRMWVRSKDWYPSHHPGKFKIVVNNHDSRYIFGQNGNKDWNWEDGGVYHLGKETELKICDISGYYGRCDVVVLASDTSWMPPSELNDIQLLREKYCRKPHVRKDMGHYDVVVIGGGVAGTLAAVQAAREGAKTVLIQNRGELGGNASSEIMVPPVGSVKKLLTDEQKKYDPGETGLIEEIATYGAQQYFKYGKQFPVRLKELAESEPNLDLFLYTHASDVIMKNNKEIKGVECFNIQTNEELIFEGEIFIDCTGNGIVGIKAGADYRYGKEPKSMYSEEKAPEKPNEETLGSSLKYWFTNRGKPQTFNCPSWAYHLPECSDFGVGRHPSLNLIDEQWMVELGGTDNTFVDAESIRDDLLRLVYGIWDHIKNHCTQLKDTASNLKLAWVQHVAGVRESYRLMGDYVMTEQDVTEQKIFPDAIAYGAWGLDDHPSLGFFEKERLSYHTHGGVMHSIPYRSLYSRNIDNLMMAGRNISVSHVALTGTRVMHTIGIIGQAAGMAAAMCIYNNTDPRGIYKKHIDDLQQKLLKTGAYLIAVPNHDDNDLALFAQVKASNRNELATKVINGFARATLPTAYYNAELQLNAWIPDTIRNEPQWIELAWGFPVKFNVLHITFLNRGNMASQSFKVEIHKDENWVVVKNIENKKLLRRLAIPLGEISTDKLRVIFDDPVINSGVTEIRVYNEPEARFQQAVRIFNQEMVPEIPANQILLPWEIIKETR